MNFLALALQYASQGWPVFPLVPREKRPLISKAAGGKGFHDATTDPAQITEWWTTTPDANIGFYPGGAGMCVLDIDTGLTLPSDLATWKHRNGIPDTYTVRTGNRGAYRVQLYFMGARPDCDAWELDGCSGDIRSMGGYVVAAGSIHPSGEAYEALNEVGCIDFMPDVVRNLKTQSRPQVEDGQPFRKLQPGDGQHADLTQQAGKLRNMGLGPDELAAALITVSEARHEPPLSIGDIEHIAQSIGNKPLPEPEPRLILGTKASDAATGPVGPPVSDWRDYFHTKEQTINAPPITFLIDHFLQCEGVTGVAAPVRERKTLISLNMVRSLLSGEPLFGKFEVTQKPPRVFYLCPEMSLGPFSARLKNLGLTDYVGDTLFYRTLSSENALELDEPIFHTALPGSVVFLDTAIRFLKGDENSSTDVRIFADLVFQLMKDGAASVVLLHHSTKGSGSADAMDLENALRGSGDMGAFLSACWGTRLQDPNHPYDSLSYIANMKQRDFESEAFEVSCDKVTGLMTFKESEAVLAPRGKFKGNKDGQDAVATQIVKDNPKASLREVARLLDDAGAKRSKDWVMETRYKLLQSTT